MQLSQDRRVAVVPQQRRAATLAPERVVATPSPPRRRTGRRVLAAVGLVLVAVVVCAGWLAVDALRARDALRATAAQVGDLQAQVLAGDRDGASRTLAALQADASVAYDRTHGPHWALAGVLPEVGPTVRAVQTVGTVVHDLATTALPSLMDATALVDPAAMAPVDGRIDLDPLVEAAPGVIAADAAVRESLATLRAVDADGVVGAVASQLVRLDDRLTDVATTTATAARAVQLLPPMLGADGPREYLLLVQNNAELRSTGGIPGSVVLLRADDGAVDVVDQRSGGSLGDLDAPVLPLSPAEQALFGEDLAADMRDVTFTPDFPRSGELARAIWQQEVGGDIDGVLSIDPGALAHVLGATGPVALADGDELSSENAVRVLLNTVYLDIANPAAQDDFFAATADSVFRAVVAGQGETTGMVDALAQGAREGRLMVWSAHPAEQALLAGTVLSGELRGVQGDSPVLGVYFNDTIAAKMGYYLQSDVSASVTACAPDGSQAVTLTLTLTSTAPADRTGLPRYVSGPGRAGVPAGDIRTNVLVYGPTGGTIEAVRADGARIGGVFQHHQGLPVLGHTVQVAPAERLVLEYDVLTGPGQPGVPAIRMTPTASGGSERVTPSNCSSPGTATR